jgi:hypothetical protein
MCLGGRLEGRGRVAAPEVRALTLGRHLFRCHSTKATLKNALRSIGELVRKKAVPKLRRWTGRIAVLCQGNRNKSIWGSNLTVQIDVIGSAIQFTFTVLGSWLFGPPVIQDEEYVAEKVRSTSLTWTASI